MNKSLPPAPPTGGNGAYIAFGALFVAGIVALVAWRSCNKPQPVVIVQPPPSASTANPRVDDVPPPPEPEPDAAVAEVKNPKGPNDPCAVRSCNGQTTPELENALAFRAKQAHRCYDTALAADSTLQGKVGISVRVAANGNVCSAGVVSNDMGTPMVAQCVANTFRMSGHFPTPKGGCVDAQIPIVFVPGGK